MVAIFEKHGIAYANWNFKAGSFGIVDDELKPDVPMIDILTSEGSLNLNQLKYRNFVETCL